MGGDAGIMKTQTQIYSAGKTLVIDLKIWQS